MRLEVKQMFRNISLGRKLAISFGLVFVLFLAVIGVYYSTVSSTTSSYKKLMAEEIAVAGHASAIEDYMLQCRRSEKDFLLRKELKYKDQWEQSYASLTEKAQAVAEIAGKTGDLTLKSKAEDIRRFAEVYRESFYSVVKSWEKRGLDHNSGLQGEFREIAHNLAAKFETYKVEPIYIQLLLLRRWEKDYYRTGGDNYKQRLNETLESLVGLIETSGVASETKSAMNKALSGYRESWEGFLSVSREDPLGLSAYEKVRDYAHQLEEAVKSSYIPNASVLLLEIRRNEKDYLLRLDPEYIEKTIATLDALKKQAADAGIPELDIKDINGLIESYRNKFKQVAAVDSEIAGEIDAMRAAVHQIEPAVEAIYNESRKAMNDKADGVNKKSASNALIALYIGLGAILIGVAVTVALAVSITRAIRKVVEFAGRIGGGDLSGRLGIDQKDEIGQLAGALDNMADKLEGQKAEIEENLNNLQAVLSEVSEVSAQVATGSAQVSDASQSLSQGATEQAASLEEITSSVTQLSSQTKMNAENASHANKLSMSSRDSAEKGNAEMREMISAMNEISESSREIAKIMKVIDDIAFQTNLLALNAAVEAARAGKHGKGFAVVAQEVRSLAGRSAKAAQETADLIEGAVKKVEHGTEIVNLTARALDEIASGITKVTDLVGEIATASNEQAQGLSQISQGLSQIEDVTQQNTANAEQTAASAEELSSQSEQLKSILQKFNSRGHGSPEPAVRKALEYEPESSTRHEALTDAWGRPPAGKKELRPRDVISLDDDDFGKF